MGRVNKIYNAYELLLAYYGKQNWWPADSQWEVCVGAILTQNTSWSNVEKAIANLKNDKLLPASKILECNCEKLEEVIRPSGYFRQKAKRLKYIAKWWQGNFDAIKDLNNPQNLAFWRNSLLAVHGVGNETADSILLYCFDAPSFVIDTYTHRMAARHLGVENQLSYKGLQDLFIKSLPCDSALYKEFHALIVLNSKQLCKKQECLPNCPLRGL